MMEPRLK